MSIMEKARLKKDFKFDDEFKKTFGYFYDEVKNYNETHYEKQGNITPSYTDIMDYISGHLSANGEMDIEWLFNEQDFKDIRGEMIIEVWNYCNSKIFEEGNIMDSSKNLIKGFPSNYVFKINSEK